VYGMTTIRLPSRYPPPHPLSASPTHYPPPPPCPHPLLAAGILVCLDGFMNIALEQTEEWTDGVLRSKFGDCFIRGNNGECCCRGHCLRADGQLSEGGSVRIHACPH